jgi:putative DeoR family transcriptional regulator (stage III sporulation protein D)
LDYHKSIRHLRGGEATKLKYKRSEREEEIVK